MLPKAASPTQPSLGVASTSYIYRSLLKEEVRHVVIVSEATTYSALFRIKYSRAIYPSVEGCGQPTVHRNT